MARIKKASKAYEKALKRAAAIKSIDPNLDLGNGITLTLYEEEIVNAKTAVEKYNTALSVADELLNRTNAQDKLLRDWNERVLTGVATRFGKDSDEYEQAGGVRKSERKRPVRRARPQ